MQIDQDVQGVANGLSEIDHHLRLRYSEAGEYYVVYFKPDEWDDGEGYAVFTTQELDQRVVHHMQEVWWKCQQPGYSFADELDKQDKEKKSAQDKKWEEEQGEVMEKMAYALRHDLGLTSARAYVPRAA